jgi:hypothetical protein
MQPELHEGWHAFRVAFELMSYSVLFWLVVHLVLYPLVVFWRVLSGKAL